MYVCISLKLQVRVSTFGDYVWLRPRSIYACMYVSTVHGQHFEFPLFSFSFFENSSLHLSTRTQAQIQTTSIDQNNLVFVAFGHLLVILYVFGIKPIKASLICCSFSIQNANGQKRAATAQCQWLQLIYIRIVYTI